MTTVRRLEIAARALLQACAHRANGAHPHAYEIPWRHATALQAVVHELAAKRREPRRSPPFYPLYTLARTERQLARSNTRNPTP